ncbi:hypothetical protein BKA63DRAFT_601917 [Paraphoma chrysanthemicola]|nr:hypothetical protein BKA63DRAFT_601917 [Paraphoma chrysanthemicola]
MALPFPGYLDHLLLPASAPEGQAHIFDKFDDMVRNAGDLDPQLHRLCDYIPTFLHNVKEQPEALASFFDPAVKTFKFLRHSGDTSDFLLALAILRKGTTVICGFQRPRDNPDEILWESLSITTLSKVAPDAVWKTTWGSACARSKLPVDECWTSGFFETDMCIPLYGMGEPLASGVYDIVASSNSLQ